MTTRPGRPSKRQQAIAAAAEQFARDGYSNVSYRDVSIALGTTAAGLYYHFPAKHDLVAAAVAPLTTAIDDLLADPPGGPDELLEALIDIVLDHRQEMAVLLADYAGIMATDFGPVVVDQHQRFVRALAGRDTTVAAQTRAEAALAAARTAGVWHHRKTPKAKLRGPVRAAALAALHAPVAA